MYPDEVGHQRDRRPRYIANGFPHSILALLAFGLGAYICVTTTLMTIRSWSPVPISDQWPNLLFSRGQVFSPWLFSQLNEHRLVFPRLIFAVDTFAFDETNRFNLFCSVAFQLVLAALLAGAVHRSSKRSLVGTVWIAGIVLAVLFSAIQYENFGL
jgi:hypothetical protein